MKLAFLLLFVFLYGANSRKIPNSRRMKSQRSKKTKNIIYHSNLSTDIKQNSKLKKQLLMRNKRGPRFISLVPKEKEGLIRR